MKLRLTLLILTISVFSTAIAIAAPLKVAVSEFKVTGAPNKEELKGTLHTLLSARLGGEGVNVVEPGEAADVVVKGNYIAFGKVFSLDARATSASGKLIAKGVEQGESADDIIPAISRLAKSLGAELSGNAAVTQPVVKSPAAAPAAIIPVASAEIIRAPETLAKPAEGDIIKSATPLAKGADSLKSPRRIEGVIIAMAPLRKSDAGAELALATANEVRLVRQESGGLKSIGLLNGLKSNDRILSIDTADLDSDGVTEIYVTMLRGENLASRVYLIENNNFKEIATNLPYFFRTIAFKGGAKKLYAQQMGREDDFFGDLFEVVKSGTKIDVANPVKLPRFANLFNVNMIKDKNGKTLTIVINPDNYLLVYDENRTVIWKSSEKFGGSEGNFTRDDIDNQRVTGSRTRKVFIEQRMFVSREGDLIVPRNEGRFIGNSREFSKSSVYALKWDESGLNEVWRTKDSQNYLSDLIYDDMEKTVITSEIVKRDGIIEKGATAIVVKKVE